MPKTCTRCLLHPTQFPTGKFCPSCRLKWLEEWRDGRGGDNNRKLSPTKREELEKLLKREEINPTPINLAAVARLFGISRERVRQIRWRIRKLGKVEKTT